MPSSEYQLEIQKWRAAKDAEIRREDGLLGLIGLFWLDKGVTTVGSSPDCRVRLPKPAPRLLGAFEFDGSKLTFGPDFGQHVEIDGKPVNSTSPQLLQVGEGLGRIRCGELLIGIVRHPERLGIQVWNSTQNRDFPPRNWYDIDEGFVVRAVYSPFPAPAKITRPDAAGGTQTGIINGSVSFKLGGKTHAVGATDTDDQRLSIRFRDLTNGIQTYPEGRYLTSDEVSEDGEVMLDFNRAVNPPSAFTTFTACSFAPKENTLNCAVRAGERDLSLLQPREAPGADEPGGGWFAANDKFVLKGEYSAYPAPIKISMPDAAGGIQQGYAQGYVTFKLDGKTHRLDATETDEGRLFIQFRDQSNGRGTYLHGRYLNTEAVADDGSVVIDFNKAANPPSATDPFSTCTFAPKEQTLNCEIEAGQRVSRREG